jgi:hypothetical protein
MNNQLPLLCTFKFYDNRRRRLTIFAKPVLETVEEGSKIKTTMGYNPILDGSLRPTHLHVYIITCSKKDQFDKKYARDLLDEFLEFRENGKDGAIAHPIELLIPIKENKPKFTFIQWCHDNFYKYKQLEFALSTPCLVKGDQMLEMDLRRSSELMQLVEDEEIAQSESEN